MSSRLTNWDDDNGGLRDEALTPDGLEGGEHANDKEFPPRAHPQRFETYALARAWAQANPNGRFGRASDGRGFEVKISRHNQHTNPAQREFDSYRRRVAEIKIMAPHLQNVLSKSASGRYGRVAMQPFYRKTWEDELGRLSTAQLLHLRQLLAIHLDESRQYLRLVDAEMRRVPSKMMSGEYGEELYEALNKIMEGAIKDIDKRLVASRGNQDR